MKAVISTPRRPGREKRRPTRLMGKGKSASGTSGGFLGFPASKGMIVKHSTKKIPEEVGGGGTVEMVVPETQLKESIDLVVDKEREVLFFFNSNYF